MAGLRQGECSRQSIKELYKVLAAFNTDNGTFYAPKDKPYPALFFVQMRKIAFCFKSMLLPFAGVWWLWK